MPSRRHLVDVAGRASTDDGAGAVPPRHIVQRSRQPLSNLGPFLPQRSAARASSSSGALTRAHSGKRWTWDIFASYKHSGE